MGAVLCDPGQLKQLPQADHLAVDLNLLHGPQATRRGLQCVGWRAVAGKRSSRRAFGPRGAGDRVTVDAPVGTLELLIDRGRPSGRMLLIDGLTHGYVDLDDPEHLELDYIARIGAAMEVLLPRGATQARVLQLGGGAFSLARFIASTRPHAEQVVIERSAAVVKLAEQHLRLRRSERLRVLTGDAAELLDDLVGEQFDLVIGDAFDGIDTPPALASPTFALAVAELLAPGGRYLLNLVDAPPWEFAARQAQILQARFADVAGFAAREVARGKHSGNLLLLASGAPLPREPLARQLAGGAHPAELIDGDAIAGRGR